jgi:hypothetical protein
MLPADARGGPATTYRPYRAGMTAYHENPTIARTNRAMMLPTNRRNLQTAGGRGRRGVPLGSASLGPASRRCACGACVPCAGGFYPVSTLPAA